MWILIGVSCVQRNTMYAIEKSVYKFTRWIELNAIVHIQVTIHKLLPVLCFFCVYV